MEKRKYESSNEEVSSGEEQESEEEEEESRATAKSNNEPRAPTQETKDSLKWWWMPCEEGQETEERQKIWKEYRGCMVGDSNARDSTCRDCAADHRRLERRTLLHAVRLGQFQLVEGG